MNYYLFKLEINESNYFAFSYKLFKKGQRNTKYLKCALHNGYVIYGI